LEQYSKHLAARPSLVAMNKVDLDRAREFKRRSRQRGVHYISALTGEGIPALLDALSAAVVQAPAPPSHPASAPTIRLRPRRSREFVVERRPWGFELRGEAADRLLSRLDTASDESLAYFQLQLDRLGISAALENAGAQPGDTVRIRDAEFEYQP
jgi:GTP-binding protein